MAYFHNTLASEEGISGDDLNRRHREQRLGYSAPSKDWAKCHLITRCIYKGQTITRAPARTDSFYNWPGAWAVDGCNPIDIV